MAANYSQYTDHNEIGGVSVGLEDAKLAAADSVDEVASTDCVLMKDASGNPVKILKEDFNEAVRDALGSILANSELGASIGRVAALGSSDNDFGSISTSDLASVLGVQNGIFALPLEYDIDSTHGADSVLDRSYHYVNYGASGIPDEVRADNGILMTLNRYMMKCQILMMCDSEAIYVRWSNGEATGSNWKSWKRIALT